MSTTPKAAPRELVVLKLPEYEVPRLVSIARSFVRAMTGNPRFPSPSPPLAVVRDAIEALAAAQTATLTRLRDAVTRRDAERRALVVVLHQLGNYVQAVANADLEHAGSIIESAGMAVKSRKGPRGRVFTAKRGAVSGSVKLVAPGAGDRASYEWAYSTDGMRTWITLPVTVRANTAVSGLARGSTVHFRYRPVTKDGAGDWSDPVAIIVD